MWGICLWGRWGGRESRESVRGQCSESADWFHRQDHVPLHRTERGDWKCEDCLVHRPYCTDGETEVQKGETLHSFNLYLPSTSLCQGLHQSLGTECQDATDSDLLAFHLEIIIDSQEVVNMVQKGPKCPSHNFPQWQHLE